MYVVNGVVDNIVGRGFQDSADVALSSVESPSRADISARRCTSG
jgi:hypothetical protein